MPHSSTLLTLPEELAPGLALCPKVRLIGLRALNFPELEVGLSNAVERVLGPDLGANEGVLAVLGERGEESRETHGGRGIERWREGGRKGSFTIVEVGDKVARGFRTLGDANDPAVELEGGRRRRDECF